MFSFPQTVIWLKSSVSLYLQSTARSMSCLLLPSHHKDFSVLLWCFLTHVFELPLNSTCSSHTFLLNSLHLKEAQNTSFLSWTALCNIHVHQMILGFLQSFIFFATWREQCREEKGEKKNTHSRDISTTGKGLTKEWVNTSCSKGPPCVVIASCNFTLDSGCLPAATFRQQNVQRKNLWHSFRDVFLGTWRPRLGLNQLILCFVAKLLSWV